MQSDSVSIVLLLPQTINAKGRASVMELRSRMSTSEAESTYVIRLVKGGWTRSCAERERMCLEPDSGLNMLPVLPENFAVFYLQKILRDFLTQDDTCIRPRVLHFSPRQVNYYNISAVTVMRLHAAQLDLVIEAGS
jgi:hypothetical protein